MNIKNELIKMAAARVIELEAARTQEASNQGETEKLASAFQALPEKEQAQYKRAYARELLKQAHAEELQRLRYIEGLQKQAGFIPAPELEKDAVNKKLIAALAAALGLGGGAVAGQQGLLGEDIQGALGGDTAGALEGALVDTDEWLGQAGGDAADWLGQAGGDAADWGSQAGTDASDWLGQAGGDVLGAGQDAAGWLSNLTGGANIEDLLRDAK
jgi:hypothetical protein